MPEKHAHAGWLKKILEQKLAKVTKLRQVPAFEFSLLAICHLSSVICDALRPGRAIGLPGPETSIAELVLSMRVVAARPL